MPVFSLGDKPGLTQLQNFTTKDGKSTDLLKSMGVLNTPLGMCLLADDDGVEMEAIKADYHSVYEITTQIFTVWLRGMYMYIIIIQVFFSLVLCIYSWIDQQPPPSSKKVYSQEVLKLKVIVKNAGAIRVVGPPIMLHCTNEAQYSCLWLHSLAKLIFLQNACNLHTVKILHNHC